jgi:hypothetical protein
MSLKCWTVRLARSRVREEPPSANECGVLAAPEAKAIWLNEESPLKQAGNNHHATASFTGLCSFSRRALAHGDCGIFTPYSFEKYMRVYLNI